MKRANSRLINFSYRRSVTLAAMLGLLLLNLRADPPVNPVWWSTKGVLKPSTPALDYSAINQGQLKNMAVGAYEHLRTTGAPLGGLGDMTVDTGQGWKLRQLVGQWIVLNAAGVPFRQILDANGDPVLVDDLPQYSTTGTGKYQIVSTGPNPATSHTDYGTVNLGTLKAVAAPFYDRLAQIYAPAGGYPKPWVGAPTPADNFAAANTGQLKNVFNFNLLRDRDEDGLTDLDELVLGLNPDDQDGDSDGLSDSEEALLLTNPLVPVDPSASALVGLEVFVP